jgi:hypothetical protein
MASTLNYRVNATRMIEAIIKEVKSSIGTPSIFEVDSIFTHMAVEIYSDKREEVKDYQRTEITLEHWVRGLLTNQETGMRMGDAFGCSLQEWWTLYEEDLKEAARVREVETRIQIALDNDKCSFVASNTPEVFGGIDAGIMRDMHSHCQLNIIQSKIREVNVEMQKHVMSGLKALCNKAESQMRVHMNEESIVALVINIWRHLNEGTNRNTADAHYVIMVGQTEYEPSRVLAQVVKLICSNTYARCVPSILLAYNREVGDEGDEDETERGEQTPQSNRSSTYLIPPPASGGANRNVEGFSGRQRDADSDHAAHFRQTGRAGGAGTVNTAGIHGRDEGHELETTASTDTSRSLEGTLVRVANPDATRRTPDSRGHNQNIGGGRRSTAQMADAHQIPNSAFKTPIGPPQGEGGAYAAEDQEGRFQYNLGDSLDQRLSATRERLGQTAAKKARVDGGADARAHAPALSISTEEDRNWKQNVNDRYSHDSRKGRGGANKWHGPQAGKAKNGWGSH